jgi:hypothetical protein
MAWTAPRSWITGEVVTAALLNAHVRDNLIDLDDRTSPVGAVVATFESTSSTTYTDLATAGPTVNVLRIGATGKALVALHVAMSNATANVASYYSFAISGATTSAASDALGIGFTSAGAFVGIRTGSTLLLTGLTPGNTTFTSKYRQDPGGTANFLDRRISVTPLGS